MTKVGVIGVGSLGSCIGYEISNRGLVNEVVLVDILHHLAEGNASDIMQAIAFRNSVNVYAGTYEDLKDAQVIVVTAGKPRTPDMKSRMDLLNINKEIIQNVATKIKNVLNEGVILTLTNPVDIMNYIMWKNTGIERSKVIGSSCMLDSARLKVVIGKRYNKSLSDVEAYVIGEHGDNQVPVFSKTRISGSNIKIGKNCRNQIFYELKQTALDLIKKKGATIFAPANNTVNIIEAILHDINKLMVCSCILNGEYGLKNLSIGVPVNLGRAGINEVIEWNLDLGEKNKFYKGADHLKTIIESLSLK